MLSWGFYPMGVLYLACELGLIPMALRVQSCRESLALWHLGTTGRQAERRRRSKLRQESVMGHSLCRNKLNIIHLIHLAPSDKVYAVVDARTHVDIEAA